MKCLSNSSQKFPCGKCAVCLDRKRKDWTFRCTKELKEHKYAHFLTLTISDDYYNDQVCNNRRHIQLWLKSLRHQVRPFRYFLVSEYGSKTGRSHYHAIIYTDEPLSSFRRAVLKTWKFGFSYFGQATLKSISYVAKYCLSGIYTNPDRMEFGKPFLLSSRNPAIGSVYLDQHYIRNPTPSTELLFNGYIQPLPKYYRDKLYTSEEKMKLRFDRLNSKKDRAMIDTAESLGLPLTHLQQDMYDNKCRLLKNKFKNSGQY